MKNDSTDQESRQEICQPSRLLLSQTVFPYSPSLLHDVLDLETPIFEHEIRFVEKLQ